MPDLDELRPRLVVPFYLQMMRRNALDHGPRTYDGDLIADVRRVAATVEPAELVMLLGAFWRERVMGAWYAIARDDRSVGAALRSALETSQGSLDAPPLLTAVTVLVGADALASIRHYAEQDATWHWGSAGIAAAAVEHLAPGSRHDGSMSPAGPEDRDAFTALLGVARALQDRA